MDGPVLDRLIDRRDCLTTLAWGGHGDAGPMSGPRRILEEDQAHLPFLLRPMDQEPMKVTHAAVCGLVRHRDEVSGRVADWFDKHRVERFTGDTPGRDVASLYVVTACARLERPVPYTGLALASVDRPLSPAKRRGYTLVFLPEALWPWFEQACRQWDALSGELPNLDPSTLP
jgi:hypothetical protein